MNKIAALGAALLLSALAACSGAQPTPVSQERARSGMPPVTGQLHNGVIEDSATK